MMAISGPQNLIKQKFILCFLEQHEDKKNSWIAAATPIYNHTENWAFKSILSLMYVNSNRRSNTRSLVFFFDAPYPLHWPAKQYEIHQKVDCTLKEEEGEEEE